MLLRQGMIWVLAFLVPAWFRVRVATEKRIAKQSDDKSERSGFRPRGVINDDDDDDGLVMMKFCCRHDSLTTSWPCRRLRSPGVYIVFTHFCNESMKWKCINTLLWIRTNHCILHDHLKTNMRKHVRAVLRNANSIVSEIILWIQAPVKPRTDAKTLPVLMRLRIMHLRVQSSANRAQQHHRRVESDTTFTNRT